MIILSDLRYFADDIIRFSNWRRPSRTICDPRCDLIGWWGWCWLVHWLAGGWVDGRSRCDGYASVVYWRLVVFVGNPLTTIEAPQESLRRCVAFINRWRWRWWWWPVISKWLLWLLWSVIVRISILSVQPVRGLSIVVCRPMVAGVVESHYLSILGEYWRIQEKL